ncbi:DUF938 domain-containing protein [Gymnodinialimonas ceratoperidinii]|uniref:DUF938 domain-containing protein n=1 Tax=Gymnodinialimonas ceratoperidinii TaxID=2856823 RepID=A0A8F6TWT7_9RHOB|nr:DUF938 domain-containing protein [Gymnodinialimonas ceratoperidinii]QXT39374.1 DUF938 domain-containing protein [Gymnodinialimonas ceratoperidinii]
MTQPSPTFDDGRLNAPAALRNRDALAAALTRIAADLPAGARALEIASGTGQHVIRFAQAMPNILWQPSDPDPDRRASIRAWVQAEPSPNIAPPISLDACTAGWAAEHGDYDLIFLANLLHLVSEPAARACMVEIARAVRPGGRAVAYGPFLRDGQTTSDGDAEFDARLRAEGQEAGYKDVAWACDIWRDAGLDVAAPAAMPANNLLLCGVKPDLGGVT